MCTAVRESSDWFSDFYKWSLCRRGYDFEDKGYHGKVFVKQGTANNLYVTLLLTSIRWISGNVLENINSYHILSL